jgi:ABC-type multidrug transport system ATPase subunit
MAPFPMRIRAERLSKKFGWVTALNDVSWEIQPGQIVAILGPNGAGKTTLLNALSGSILLDSGQVFFDDHLYTPGREDLRKRFAFIPDIPPVPPHWTPLRFIGTALKLYGATGVNEDQRVKDLLVQLDLLEVAGWRFRQLSRGQTYKAVLAGFLAADPEVWLVDEPFASGMDPRGLNCFKQYARAAAARGRTIIFTTQIIEVAEQLAHHICILNKGRIEAFDEPAKIHSSFASHLREQPPV